MYRRLEKAEADYLHKKDHTWVLRERRDELTGELYEKVVLLRGVLERVYGKKRALLVTGIEGKTPRDPHDLAQVALALVDRLRSYGPDLPEPDLPGLEFSPEETAAALEPLARGLADAWRALQGWHRQVELLLLARNEAREELDELVVGMSEMLQGLYVASGLRHLVPGIRNPGASIQRAMREAPRASLERARAALADADRQNPASHPVRRRVPVGESGPRPLRARSELGGTRSRAPITASADSKSSSHPVRTRLETHESSSRGSILRFERPNSASHPVQRRNRGENSEERVPLEEMEGGEAGERPA